MIDSRGLAIGVTLQRPIRQQRASAARVGDAATGRAGCVAASCRRFSSARSRLVSGRFLGYSSSALIAQRSCRLAEEVAHRQHRHHHRVVLVVVAVGAVAADQSAGSESAPRTGGRRQPPRRTPRRRPGRPSACARPCRRAPARDAPARSCPALAWPARPAPGRTCDHNSSPMVQKYSRPRAGLGRIRHHVGAPVLEVLDAADLDRRVVNVDPVVRRRRPRSSMMSATVRKSRYFRRPAASRTNRRRRRPQALDQVRSGIVEMTCDGRLHGNARRRDRCRPP